MDTRELQERLTALGYAPGPVDGLPGQKTTAAVKAFQRDHGLVADGDAGPVTQAALLVEMAKLERGPSGAGVVPGEWMPAANMKGIVVHWTAGAHRASGLDRSHYHLLIEADGKLVRGTPSITLNDASGLRPGYAAHTLNCNTGWIGVSLCCMAGAVENPFNAGSAPMTRVQWNRLAEVCADLCRRYRIPVSPRTLLSHAEVQDTLGIKQRGKWDIARLAFEQGGIVGAKACGDRLRAAVAGLI